MPALKSACPGSNPTFRKRTPYKAANHTLAEQHPPVKGIAKIPPTARSGTFVGPRAYCSAVPR